MKKNFEHTEFGADIDYNERERRCMKIRAKALRNNLRMKATANVTTKPGFSEDQNGQTES